MYGILQEAGNLLKHGKMLHVRGQNTLSSSTSADADDDYGLGWCTGRVPDHHSSASGGRVPTEVQEEAFHPKPKLSCFGSQNTTYTMRPVLTD
jgi:hypothetical protein